MNLNRIIFLSFAVVTLIFLNSCISVLPVLSSSGEVVTEREGTDFIEMKDGNFIDGVIEKDNLWELIFKKESGSLKISGNKIANKDIIAFQTDRKYYRKNSGNIFCKRIVKGNINVYEKKREGENAKGKSFYYSLFFLQKGVKDKIVDFDKKILLSMVSDFPPASHWLSDGIFKKKNQDWYFDKAISTYNTK